MNHDDLMDRIDAKVRAGGVILLGAAVAVCVALSLGLLLLQVSIHAWGYALVSLACLVLSARIGYWLCNGRPERGWPVSLATVAACVVLYWWLYHGPIINYH